MKIRDIEFDHPWQTTPTRLIQFGLEFLEEYTKYHDKLVAFLLIDVGIESLFKIYLSLDKEVTKSKVSYEKRQKAIKGSFYLLVETVKESTADQIDNDIFEEVKYYHKIRNKLYHQGDGVLPSKINLRKYGEISKNLLKELLNVDLFPSGEFGDNLEEINEQMAQTMYAGQVAENLNKLRHDLSGIVGCLRPEWVKRSFVDQVHSIWEEFPDDIDDDPRVWELNNLKRDPKFNKLLNREIEDSWFIKESVHDIHFLYLALVLQQIGKIDDKELENYVSAGLFSESRSSQVYIMRDGLYQWRREEFEGEREEITNDLIKWMESVQQKIEDLLDSKISCQEE